MKAEAAEAAQSLIANILRVDHAGECGAIRIYEAQVFLAKWRAPDLTPFLQHTLADERRHRDTFAGLMRERGVRPCRTLAFWGIGGAMLGLLTASLGRSAILVCTEAVERTVHRHLDDQIRWLSDRETAIAEAISRIQTEELEHLQFAEDRRKPSRLRGLDRFVGQLTEALIWLSTYGASSRMARDLARP